MSARAASSALILSLLIAPGLFRSAHAGPWLPAPGEHYTELRGGLFSADSYHDNAGDRVSLGGKWEERSVLGTVELGWKKRLSVVMAAPFISATRRDAVGSTTSTGLEDFLLGFRYGIHQGRTALAAELDWQAPLGYSRDSSLFARPQHGGGLEQLSLSLLLGTPLAKRGFLQLGAGYEYFSTRDVSISNVSPTLTDGVSYTFLYGGARAGDFLSSLPQLFLYGTFDAGSLKATEKIAYSDGLTVEGSGSAFAFRVGAGCEYFLSGSWSTTALFR